MSTMNLWKRLQEQETVRPRSGGIPVFLCVLIFAITAIVVNRLGRERWTPVSCQATHTATAYALDQRTGVKTPFTCTDADPWRAAEMASELAERHADDCLAQWQRAAEQTRLKARKLVEKARQDQRENLQRLEAFQQRHKAAQAQTQSQANANRLKMSQPATTANPRWLDARDRVSNLQQRREQLLRDRTPSHPMVQEITARLTEAQQQLAAISHHIPSNQPKVANADNAPVLLAPAIDDLAAQENQQRLNELTAAVEKSRLACQKAEDAQKQAAEQQRARPQYVIQNAESAQDLPQVDYGWRRLLWTTFATGLLMAFGVGSVAAGARIEPPVASIEEVQSALGRSVIGTMPADDPTLDLASIRCQAQARRATIAIGLILIAACPIVAIWGVMGI
jgi:hypothetical protein